MAVSKRTRYEVLRRDNHTCRYCGGAAPDVTLTVDHVVPVSLGGTDNPDNLVAACRDCNAGKAASNPDAPLLENVRDDALRWSEAMQVAAAEIRAQRDAVLERVHAFQDAWDDWTFVDFRGKRWPIADLPLQFEKTIEDFLAAGLVQRDFEELIGVAMTSSAQPRNIWRYFCGCCWNRVREIQAKAAETLEPAPTEWPGLPTTPEEILFDIRFSYFEGYADGFDKGRDFERTTPPRSRLEDPVYLSAAIEELEATL